MSNYQFLLLSKPLLKRVFLICHILIYTSYTPLKKYGVLFLLISQKKNPK